MVLEEHAYASGAVLRFVSAIRSHCDGLHACKFHGSSQLRYALVKVDRASDVVVVCSRAQNKKNKTIRTD